MSFRTVAAKGIEIFGSTFLACNTQLDHGEEVEAYRGDFLTSHILTELPFEAIVWFFVEVEVNAHDSETASVLGGMFDISFANRFLHITHQHKSIVIDRLFCINIGIGQRIT